MVVLGDFDAAIDDSVVVVVVAAVVPVFIAVPLTFAIVAEAVVVLPFDDSDSPFSTPGAVVVVRGRFGDGCSGDVIMAAAADVAATGATSVEGVKGELEPPPLDPKLSWTDDTFRFGTDFRFCIHIGNGDIQGSKQ
jgi:hypothetical protein